MSEETKLAERPQTVRDFLALPQYQNRFKEVLSDRAPQFMSSLVTISNERNLADCEPRSLIAGAMIAATLDFPLEKQLGLAHLVPYNSSRKLPNGEWVKEKVAQFQMGYKGYIQLAHRSGQYAKMNARLVNKEAFIGYDDVGEPEINWEKLDETLPAIGCVFAFKLINGFTKVCYWSKEKIEAHAKRFSKAVQGGKQDSPWFTNPEAMWKKTVVMNELRAWGILSVQMAKALQHDMGAQKDVDADVEYIDNESGAVTTEPAEQTPARPAPPPRAKKGAAAVKENAPIDVETTPATTTAAPKDVTPPPAEADAAKAHAVAEALKAEKKADAQPKPPRSTLKDKEQADFTCTIDKVYALMVNVAGALTPSVQANVTGDFVGTVLHFGGATKQGEDLVPRAEWKEGATVVLSLLGRLNAKTGKVLTVVQKIAAEESPDKAMEVS